MSGTKQAGGQCPGLEAGRLDCSPADLPLRKHPSLYLGLRSPGHKERDREVHCSPAPRAAPQASSLPQWKGLFLPRPQGLLLVWPWASASVWIVSPCLHMLTFHGSSRQWPLRHSFHHWSPWGYTKTGGYRHKGPLWGLSR